MKIEVGRYYTLNTTEEGFEHEKYVMLVLPRSDSLPEQQHRTETLGLHNLTMWQNDWLEEYFQREANQEEVDLFQTERLKYDDKLQGIGEMVSGGFKIDKIEDLPKMIEFLSR